MGADEISEDQIRGAHEIAKRAVVLFAVVRVALGAPKAETLAWLQSESLWQELSPEEASFLSANVPDQQQVINASWRSEALLMLVWSLNLLDKLPPLNEQCDIEAFQSALPPFAGIATAAFFSSASRRSDEELTGMADEVLNSHWEARDAYLHRRPTPSHLNAGIVQERHHGINWVIGYGGSPWDEVATDT